MEMNAEVMVIGAGPAGYSLAMRLAQRGLDVVCVEGESVGGVCLNWGCIPSKALISVANRYVSARESEDLGLSVTEARLDMARVVAHQRRIVRHHTEGVANLLQSNGARVVKGRARLVGASRVAVDRVGTFTASRAVVIATGAHPTAPRGFEPNGQTIVSAKDGVFPEHLPEHLIVLGGGVIGLELGTAHLRLGSRLTLIEVSEQLLAGIDPDLTRVVERKLQERGATILRGTRALDWQARGAGVVVRVEGPDGNSEVEGSRVLVATGFAPNSQNLGLEALGVKLDARGHIVTDGRCETNVAGVFALGDVAGPPYLAHRAFKDAEILADVLSGSRAERDVRAMPAAIFTHPEIAGVGLSETQARATGRQINVARFPFSALGRAQALGEPDGFVKLIAEGERLVGGWIVGAEASELVAELTLAIEVGATLEDLALTVHTHPTLSEALHEAAELGLGRAVHVLNRVRKGRPVTQVASSNP
jgi:dihydrolipoamide dehydrogenase